MRLLNLQPAHKEIVAAILEASPTGMDIGEIRRALKVIDKVQSAANSVTLDDSEFDYIAKRFKETKFTRISKEVVDLADAIDFASVIEISGN